jgi:hypothetical protein
LARAAPRPRPPAVPGRTFPRAHAARLLGVLPGRTPSCPRCTGWARATNHWSDGGVPPYARRPRPGTTAASSTSTAITPEQSRAYKYPAFPLLRRHCHAAAPSTPLQSSSAPSCLPRSSNRPYPFLRAYKAIACHLLSRRSPRHRRSRATAATAVGPRRAPTPACSLPQHRSSPDPR